MSKAIFTLTAVLLFSNSSHGATNSELEKNLERLRQSKACVGCNFANFDFTTLENKDILKGARLTKAVLSGVNVSGLNLDGVRLDLAQITKSTFAKSSLIKADFRSAKIENSNFESANLQSAIMNSASIIGGTFENASLQEASVREAMFKDTNLSLTNLSRIRMESSLVLNSDMRAANLRNATVIHSDIASTRVEGTIVTNTLFAFVRFPETNSGGFFTDDILDFYNSLNSTRGLIDLPRGELAEIGTVLLEYNRRLGIDVGKESDFIASFSNLRTQSEFNSSIIYPIYRQANMLQQLGGHGANPIVRGLAETIRSINPSASAVLLRQFKLQPLSGTGGSLSQRVLPSFNSSMPTFSRVKADPGRRIADFSNKDYQRQEGAKIIVQFGSNGTSAGHGIAIARDPKTKDWTFGIVKEASAQKEISFGGNVLASLDAVFSFDTNVNNVKDFNGTGAQLTFTGGDKVQAGVGLSSDLSGNFTGVSVSLGGAASTGPNFGVSVGITETVITPIGEGEVKETPNSPPPPPSSGSGTTTPPDPEKPTESEPSSGGSTPSENAAQNIVTPTYGDDAVDSEALALILPQILSSLGCDTTLNQACNAFLNTTKRDRTGYILPAACLISDKCLSPEASPSQESVAALNEWKDLKRTLPNPLTEPASESQAIEIAKFPQICRVTDLCAKDPSIKLPVPFSGRPGISPGGDGLTRP